MTFIKNYRNEIKYRERRRGKRKRDPFENGLRYQ